MFYPHTFVFFIDSDPEWRIMHYIWQKGYGAFFSKSLWVVIPNQEFDLVLSVFHFLGLLSVCIWQSSAQCQLFQADKFTFMEAVVLHGFMCWCSKLRSIPVKQLLCSNIIGWLRKDKTTSSWRNPFEKPPFRHDYFKINCNCYSDAPKKIERKLATEEKRTWETVPFYWWFCVLRTNSMGP